MEIKDMESLTQITREIEAQGYTVNSVEGEKKYSGHPTLEIALVFSRKRDVTENDNAQYFDTKPNK
jgi:hypothetical protein